LWLIIRQLADNALTFVVKIDSFVKIENGMGKFKKEHNAKKQARE
jgi:hypothetical protein